jgi:hypothetical protein
MILQQNNGRKDADAVFMVFDRHNVGYGTHKLPRHLQENLSINIQVRFAGQLTGSSQNVQAIGGLIDCGVTGKVIKRR